MASTTQNTEKLGVALIGAGIFVKEAHLPALSTLSSTLSLLAIYSRTPSSTTSLLTYISSTHPTLPLPEPYSGPSGLADLLGRKDIHLVIIALPIPAQPAVIIQALNAGKHVLSEKPVAQDVGAATELIKEYRTVYARHGLVWRVAENFETERGFVRARELVQQGKIGDVRTFALQALMNVGEDGKYYKTEWRKKPEYQGGFLLDGGVHYASLLRTILPSSPARLSAYATLNAPHLAPHDTLHASVQCEDGVSGTFQLSFSAPSPDPQTLLLTGSSGQLRLSRSRSQTTLRLTSADGKTTTEETHENGDGVREELRLFVERVQRARAGKGQGQGQGVSEREDVGDPREALRDLAFLQAGLESKGEKRELGELVVEFPE